MVGGDGAEALEEAHPGSGRAAPCGFDEVVGGAHGEGGRVEGDRRAGQGLASVAEVAFGVVAAGLENVEGFVLDLPSVIQR